MCQTDASLRVYPSLHYLLNRRVSKKSEVIKDGHGACVALDNQIQCMGDMVAQSLKALLSCVSMRFGCPSAERSSAHVWRGIRRRIHGCCMLTESQSVQSFSPLVQKVLRQSTRLSKRTAKIFYA
jgi:hypothetical protein